MLGLGDPNLLTSMLMAWELAGTWGSKLTSQAGTSLASLVTLAVEDWDSELSSNIVMPWGKFSELQLALSSVGSFLVIAKLALGSWLPSLTTVAVSLCHFLPSEVEVRDTEGSLPSCLVREATEGPWQLPVGVLPRALWISLLASEGTGRGATSVGNKDSAFTFSFGRERTKQVLVQELGKIGIREGPGCTGG